MRHRRLAAWKCRREATRRQELLAATIPATTVRPPDVPVPRQTLAVMLAAPADQDVTVTLAAADVDRLQLSSNIVHFAAGEVGPKVCWGNAPLRSRL